MYQPFPYVPPWNGQHRIMTLLSVVVAGKRMGLDAALERLERYPARTPAIYDFPGPGDPSAITPDEIRRTRAVSSRISAAEGDWFISLATTAPWTPVGGDIRDADPAISGGLYDSMLDLYGHFTATAPRGVSTAKISKVLHLKRPTQFPILDSRLVHIYEKAAAREAKKYPSRGRRRMLWAAIRWDLVQSSDALAELRRRMGDHTSARVRALQAVSDLRLHDMLTW
jgi:hypothetical protein